MEKPSSPAQEINELHVRMNGIAGDAVKTATRIGELLSTQQQACKHGTWLPWLNANITFSRRTAYNYMRTYQRRDKFANVANLSETYRLSPPRQVNGESKPRPYRRAAPPPHPLNAQILALAEQGMPGKQIALELGISERTVQRELEHDALKRQVQPQVDVELLSLSAQQRLALALKQQKAKLEAQFHLEVNARVKEFLSSTIGPQLEKEQKEAAFVIKSRKGIMNRKQFNQIRACLHTDRVPGPEEKHEAFILFTSFEKLLLKEAESPTKFANIPTTVQGWDELKRTVAEQRKASKNKGTAIRTK